jgi:hypothetical protein
VHVFRIRAWLACTFTRVAKENMDAVSAMQPNRGRQLSLAALQMSLHYQGGKHSEIQGGETQHIVASPTLYLLWELVTNRRFKTATDTTQAQP